MSARAADAFVPLVDHFQRLLRTPAPSAAELAHGLAQLMQGGERLPLDPGDGLSDTLWETDLAPLDDLGDLPVGYFRVALDPHDPHSEDIGCGLMVDDLRDVDRDLRMGKRALAAGALADAVFHWQVHFKVHWGEHAAECLLACILCPQFSLEWVAPQRDRSPTAYVDAVHALHRLLAKAPTADTLRRALTDVLAAALGATAAERAAPALAPWASFVLPFDRYATCVELDFGGRETVTRVSLNEQLGTLLSDAFAPDADLTSSVLQPAAQALVACYAWDGPPSS